MNRMKVLISDPLAKDGIRLLKEEEGIEVDTAYELSAAELKRRIVGCQALIVRSQTQVTKDIIEVSTDLKVIGRAGVGVDNIDVEAASKKGIIVMNAPEGNTTSTAEHTISMILALSRNIPQANASLKSGKWERKRFVGTEVYNKILGIVGLGRIGSEVAKKAKGLDMKVIACDPYVSADLASRIKTRLVGLDQLLGESDYITVHTPLTQSTRNLIDKDQFDIMKEGVYIINCARGGIINENALCEAIKSGKVRGAALDVFENEPPLNSSLLEMDRVIVTPHLGASTVEAQVNVAVDVVRQVIDALKGVRIRNAVNVPSIEPEEFEVIKPYLNLAEKMGSLQTQYIGGRTEEVRIKYSGDVTNYNIAPITIAFLKGLFEPILEEGVNYVNAPIIARERGVKVNVTRSSEIEDFATLISVEVIADKKKTSLAGTLFADREPRIVKVNDYRLTAIPSGHMLIVTNEDKPGMVGKLGTVLGDNNVNIADMTLGRITPGGYAVVVLNLDGPLPPGVLEEINRMENVVEAKIVDL